MDSRTKQDFTRRITQSNRSELVVVLYGWYQKIYVKYSYEKAYRVVFQTEDAKQYYGKSLEKK